MSLSPARDVAGPPVDTTGVVARGLSQNCLEIFFLSENFCLFAAKINNPCFEKIWGQD